MGRQLDIRPEQRWRLRNGHEVTVQQVTGEDQIHCAVHPPLIRGGTQELGDSIPGMVAANTFSVEDFLHAELLRPLFRASFGAKVRGHGLEEPVMQALHEIASVERRGTPRIDTGTNVIHGDHAEYVIELAAPDRDAAETTILEKLGDDLVSRINLVEV
jgi:hypothetical protein